MIPDQVAVEAIREKLLVCPTILPCLFSIQEGVQEFLNLTKPINIYPNVTHKNTFAMYTEKNVPNPTTSSQ
tara:strand:+ start:37672 stop:37884 length:213 start_codon:yes stop_codon:yes gene_type:complete